MLSFAVDNMNGNVAETFVEPWMDGEERAAYIHVVQGCLGRDASWT